VALLILVPVYLCGQTHQLQREQDQSPEIHSEGRKSECEAHTGTYFLGRAANTNCQSFIKPFLANNSRHADAAMGSFDHYIWMHRLQEGWGSAREGMLWDLENEVPFPITFAVSHDF